LRKVSLEPERMNAAAEDVEVDGRLEESAVRNLSAVI
jgi:hypothetical protein